MSDDTEAAGSQRLGTYWHSATFDLARRAYLADLDTVPDGPDSLGAWIDTAIRAHADLSPQRRAEIADSLPPETRDPRGKSRSFIVAVRTVEALETCTDRGPSTRPGRVTRRVRQRRRPGGRPNNAQERYGGPLPPAPARLPNRPPRADASQRS